MRHGPGWVVPVIAGVLASHGASAADAMERSVRALSARPWSALVECDLYIGDHARDRSYDAGPTRSVSHRAWFEPAGPDGDGPVVVLELNAMVIEVRPGRLRAVHRGNIAAYFQSRHGQAGDGEAGQAGVTVAEMLNAELPPLWSPWLAMALERDAGAWPRLGSAGLGSADAGAAAIVWDDTPQRTPPEETDEPGLRYTGVVGRPGVGVSAFVSVGGEPGDLEEEGGGADAVGFAADPVLSRYTIAFLDRPEALIMDFSATFDAEPMPRPVIDTAGRTRVDTLADLMPPPPEIGFGDRLPTLSLSALTAGELGDRRWRPLEVFEAERRPAALVLVLVRPGADAQAWLKDAAALLRRGARAAGGEAAPVRVVARPFAATRTEEADPDRLEPLRAAWAAAYRADPSLAGAESAAPDLAWAPASALLDRVAPAAAGAMVVVDRSGWITGVIGSAASADEAEAALAEALRAAGR